VGTSALIRDIIYMRRVIEGKDVKLVVIDALMA
jgi:hypothetical protein